jgi:[acyl-carrier-protein] S-malonyltransferase
LNVSGAFHSSLMKPAADKMAGVLAAARSCRRAVPVVANVDARPARIAQQIREKLVRQIDHAVLWEDTLKWMIGRGLNVY